MVCFTAPHDLFGTKDKQPHKQKQALSFSA